MSRCKLLGTKRWLTLFQGTVILCAKGSQIELLSCRDALRQELERTSDSDRGKGVQGDGIVKDWTVTSAAEYR